MAPARSYRDLKVWQKAHRMVLSVYKGAAAFPADERYGLTSQMKRAALSVPANIVEGFNRSTDADKQHFYIISRGSLEEVRYYFEVVEDLGWLSKDVRRDKAFEQLSKMLNALIRSMDRRR